MRIGITGVMPPGGYCFSAKNSLHIRARMMFNRGTATLHAVSTELGSVEIDVIIPSKSYRE